jgi:hypothetical protein
MRRDQRCNAPDLGHTPRAGDVGLRDIECTALEQILEIEPRELALPRGDRDCRRSAQLRLTGVIVGWDRLLEPGDIVGLELLGELDGGRKLEQPYASIISSTLVPSPRRAAFTGVIQLEIENPSRPTTRILAAVIGEKWHQRMGTHRDHCAGVERYQRFALLRRQARKRSAKQAASARKVARLASS